MKKPLFASFTMGVLMLLSSALTVLITPSLMVAGQQNKLDLGAIIPLEFDGWKMDLSAASLLVSPDVKGEINKIYNQELARTYINKQGERVMLAIAYGGDQSTDLHVHRPEICYASSGFDVGKMTKTFVDTTLGKIPVMHLVAKKGIRNEPISYWIRVGDSLTRGWFEQKWAAFGYGLSGQVPDGLLFRISTISNDEQESYRIQQSFLTALLQAVRSEDRYWLVGRVNSRSNSQSGVAEADVTFVKGVLK
jgi:EpsI family protein